MGDFGKSLKFCNAYRNIIKIALTRFPMGTRTLWGFVLKTIHVTLHYDKELVYILSTP
jgi:hypothetical protein